MSLMSAGIRSTLIYLKLHGISKGSKGEFIEEIRSKDGTTIALGRSGQGSPIILVGGAFQHRAIDPQTAHALYCGRLGKSSVDPDIERGVQGSSVRLTKVAAACPISCGESSWTKCAPRTMTSS
jgi:hypothetical protein